MISCRLGVKNDKPLSRAVTLWACTLNFGEYQVHAQQLPRAAEDRAALWQVTGPMLGAWGKCTPRTVVVQAKALEWARQRAEEVRESGLSEELQAASVMACLDRRVEF